MVFNQGFPISKYKKTVQKNLHRSINITNVILTFISIFFPTRCRTILLLRERNRNVHRQQLIFL